MAAKTNGRKDCTSPTDNRALPACKLKSVVLPFWIVYASVFFYKLVQGGSPRVRYLSSYQSAGAGSNLV